MSHRSALAVSLSAAASHAFVWSIAFAAILTGLVSTPALAQPVTIAQAVSYTGTLGGQAIVLELTELKDGPILGRYSYLSNGADIPLHALSSSPSDTILGEEVPCTSALCERPDGNLVLDPPLGGQFQLHYSVDDTKLTGTWRASASASVELPVELTRFGQRAYDRNDDFYYGSFIWSPYDAAIAPNTSPYDYAKMQVTLTEGPVQTLYGATYREVIDPRTKFPFPRIVSLPGGGDIAPVNTVLDQQRSATNFTGFQCLGWDYLSGGWMALPFGTGGNSLGGIDQDKISIDYLSDTVMTIHQAGISSCNGAPEDFIEYHTYDVRAGRVLDPSQIFKHWDATSKRPTQPLIYWVIAAYRKASGHDANDEAGCVTYDHLDEGLEVSFAQDDVAVFQIGYIEADSCMGPIVSVPLADIKDLLTDKATDYFPLLTSR